jgi:hypothetical protein
MCSNLKIKTNKKNITSKNDDKKLKPSVNREKKKKRVKILK